jgi:predicted phosphodiesterase
MLALLYDIHGNLPALEAVIADARAEGADRWLLGGDVAAFGAWPAETVERLRALEAATWIRGNTERWLSDRSDLPTDQPMHAAALACREELGDAVADELAALPERASLPGHARSQAVGRRTLAVHASPISDMRSFDREAGDDDEELLGDVRDGRLVFGHTHIAFRRHAGPVELLNPGSVGMPLDGDPRAAYALVRDDGEVEQRRVTYDHAESAAELTRRYGEEPWVAIVRGRIEHARLAA